MLKTASGERGGLEVVVGEGGGGGGGDTQV